MKKESQVYIIHAETDKPDIVDTLLARFSSWYSLKKAIAWILRAKSILLHKIRKGDQVSKPCGNLSVSEILAADKEIVRYIQMKSFNDTLFKSGCYRKLAPSRSSDGIIRVGGRLNNATLSDDAKHPCVLPSRHFVVSLIMALSHNDRTL